MRSHWQTILKSAESTRVFLKEITETLTANPRYFPVRDIRRVIEPPEEQIIRQLVPKNSYQATRIILEPLQKEAALYERVVLPHVPLSYQGQFVQIDVLRRVEEEIKTRQRRVSISEIVVPLSGSILGFVEQTVLYELATNYDLFAER